MGGSGRGEGRGALNLIREFVSRVGKYNKTVYLGMLTPLYYLPKLHLLIGRIDKCFQPSGL